MIVYRRLINMVPGGQVSVINMSQYDSDVTLEFELYASEGTFVVESGTTVLIRGTKPDGNGISIDGEIESTQDPETRQYVHLVTIEVDQQMTAIAGKSLYELSLRKDNKELNTANFVLDIERAPLDADTVPSESVIREIDEAVEEYLDEHDIVIDATLTQEGKVADAKAVGDALAAIEPGLSDDAKAALLACFAHVVWADEPGQDYYDALENALYPDAYPKITATFTQGSAIIYSTDSLDRLKQYLVVTYYADSESQGTVVPSTDYTLDGELSDVSSLISVRYSGKTANFSVNVTLPVFEYKSSNGVLLSEMENVDTYNSSGTQASESLVDGHLLLSVPEAPNGSSPIYKQFRIVPNTFTSGMMRVKFNMMSLPYSQGVYNGMRLRISNGNGGVSVGESLESGKAKAYYAEGSTIKTAGSVSLNEWHMKNGTQSIVIDGETVVDSKTYSTTSATNNSIFAQNSVTTSTVQFYIDEIQLYDLSEVA